MTRIAVDATSPTGLRWPNYVNGRLLTALDLSADQDAVLERDSWLGRAIGRGVAEGLEVTGSPGSSVLHVSPGTGVPPGGTAVHLDAPAALDLAVVSSSAPVDGVKFADCAPATTSTKAPSAGAYVLAMCPASSYDGQVPVAGTPAAGATATQPTRCTSRWEVEDVVFVVVRLDGFAATTTTVKNRRNLLAHWCFGSAALDDLALSGFTGPVPYGGIDALAELTECDLPLAVFDWDGEALVFVDRWSARHRPVRPSAAVGLAAVVSDQRTAEGEARFLQFQDQLAGLASTSKGRSARALDVFPLLPPAGLVPIEPFAAASLLLAVAQPDFGVAAPAAPAPASPPPARPPRQPPPQPRGEFMSSAASSSAASLSTPTGALKALLDNAPAAIAAAAASGESGLFGQLGALSAQLQEMQAEIDALRAEVEGHRAALGGGGAQGPSAAARARAQQLASAVVGLLVDTAGAGMDPAAFFDGLELRLGVVTHETVDFTIRRSWYDEPIDLGTGRAFNVFFVVSSDGETVAPYLLFAKRQRGIYWLDQGSGGRRG